LPFQLQLQLTIITLQFSKPVKNSGLNGVPPTGFGNTYGSRLLSGHELLICNTDKMNS